MGIRRFVALLSSASVAVLVVLAVSPRWPGPAGDPRPLPASVARTIVVVSGDRQVSDPGTALPEPIVARVLDGDGRPVRGATVRFTAPEPAAGRGLLFDGRPTSLGVTDAAGRASARGVAPTRSGTTTVVAWAAGSRAEARITVSTVEATGAVALSGDGSGVRAGSRTAPMEVQVVGSGGRPLAGVAVRFELAELPPVSVGSIVRFAEGDDVDVVTGADGRVAVTAIAGAHPGPVTVRARVLGAPSAPMARFALVVVAPET